MYIHIIHKLPSLFNVVIQKRLVHVFYNKCSLPNKNKTLKWKSGKKLNKKTQLQIMHFVRNLKLCFYKTSMAG